MDEAVRTQLANLDDQTTAFLAKIANIIPIMADLSRADVLIGVMGRNNQIRVIEHARPHSIAPVYREFLVGQYLARADANALYHAIEAHQFARGMREASSATLSGESVPAPVVQEAYPIDNSEGQTIGGLLIATNLIESERLRRRNDAFQRILKTFQQNALRGELEGIENISPFGERDGIIIAESDGTIRYMSGIAVNLYRNIGYGDQLVGKPLSYLETQDDELVRQGIATRRCIQVETEERGRHWIKKVIPVYRSERISIFSSVRPSPNLAFLLIHDDTEEQRRARELLIKTTMIKELHHRVKNDLQTVASLLRMQTRRLKTPEAKGALTEAVNRVLSVAVIHEFLSVQDTRSINVREVAQRIAQQMQDGLLDPSRSITFALSGPNIYLPARQATSCALVINELLQNALEHGFDLRIDEAQTMSGTIAITFEDFGDAVGLIVHDDGNALPPDFNLDNVGSLGLKVVQMLVKQDLQGQIEMQSDHGVSAIVRFPKVALGGDEKWNEPE